MDVMIIACGVFKPELDIVLEELRAEGFDQCEIQVLYLEMALHNDIKKLKATVSKALEEHRAEDRKLLLLFGSICHPEIREICAAHCALIPDEKNCIDMFVDDGEKERLSGGGEVFFLTHGWLSNWKNSLVESGWDTYDARMNFGRYDSFLLLDSGIAQYSDEQLLDFYEYTTVPIEIESITLGRFSATVKKLLMAAMQ